MQSEKGKLDRVTWVTDPLGGVNKECYYKSGNVSNITDVNGGTTGYTYDNTGHIER